jgi:hypothetical protein
MHASRVGHGAIWFGLVLGLLMVLPFKLGADEDKKEHKKEFARFTCGNQTVKVVPVDGTQPKAVYLCGGDTMTWDANGHTFIVVFKKKSPFVGGQKIFDNQHYQSRAAKDDVLLTVYNYDMVVDGEPVDDPQVVGGGGHTD